MFICKKPLIALGRTMVLLTRKKHSLPQLPYSYDALQPIISKEIMEIHHTKHHATYIANLNAAEEQLQDAISKNDTTKIIQLQPAVRFNGGGHINHSIFWQNLSPDCGKPSVFDRFQLFVDLEKDYQMDIDEVVKGKLDLSGPIGEEVVQDYECVVEGNLGLSGPVSGPIGDLCKALDEAFGSFDAFKTKMAVQTTAVQGSGWGWLGFNPSTKRLEITACANQDPLQATTGLIPLFGIDVWEHAYYLQYKNVRADYVKAVFDIVNWSDVSKRFDDAKK